MPQHDTYMHLIRDRLASFRATVEVTEDTEFRLSWPFGWLSLSSHDDMFTLSGGAKERSGLARIKDLLATAFKLYAKADAPEIVWGGRSCE